MTPYFHYSIKTMSIEKLEQFEDGLGLRWIANGTKFEHRFISKVIAVPLRSGTGILVVEPAGDEAPHNATILLADGHEMKRIRNPEASNGAIGFGDAYYVRDELTLFIFFASWQMGCVINEEGDVLRVYESR
jgi:hypothetical protein